MLVFLFLIKSFTPLKDNDFISGVIWAVLGIPFSIIFPLTLDEVKNIMIQLFVKFLVSIFGKCICIIFL